MKNNNQIAIANSSQQSRGSVGRNSHNRAPLVPAAPQIQRIHRVPAGAFSLVEVLIVVVILAILASVLLPAIADPATSRLRGAATILARDIQYVQSEAMNTSQILQINFVSDTQYQVVDPDGGTGGSAVLLRYPQLDYPAHGGQFIVDFDDPSPLRGTTMQSFDFGGQSRLEFGRFGEPTAGGEIVLRSGDYLVRISVAPVTGMVTVGNLEAAQ
jgi:prepilin-type N-terminal cleavage/methylation domain-containing protein